MYEVRESPIHGMGLFATENIPAKTRLSIYDGEEMTLKEFRIRYGNDTRHTYSMRRINKIIVGKGRDNPSHWCNESKEPNVCMMKRGLYTLRDVVKGEEMTLKYPLGYLRDDYRL